MARMRYFYVDRRFWPYKGTYRCRCTYVEVLLSNTFDSFSSFVRDIPAFLVLYFCEYMFSVLSSRVTGVDFVTSSLFSSSSLPKASCQILVVNAMI